MYISVDLVCGFRVLLAGDFNTKVSENVMDILLYHDDLNNLAEEKICFKNVNNHSIINLLLTNNSLVFENTTKRLKGYTK